MEICICCDDASDVEMEVAVASKAVCHGEGGGVPAVSEVLLSESAMFGVVGSRCTRRPRTDSRSMDTILWVGSAVHC